MLKGGKIFTTSGISSFIGKLGEVAVDMTKKTLVVFDGNTPGGTPLALQNHTHPNATDTVSGFLSAADHVFLYNHRHAVATETADGFMSQIDKIKLDSIATSGTQSGNLIQNGEFEVAGTTDVFLNWSSFSVDPSFSISQTTAGGISNNYCYMTNNSPVTITAGSSVKANIQSSSFSAAANDFITVTGFWNSYANGSTPANIRGITQAFVRVTFSDNSTVDVGTLTRPVDTNGFKIFSVSIQIPTPAAGLTISKCAVILNTTITNSGGTSQAVVSGYMNGGFDSIFVYKQTLPLATPATPNTIVYRDANGNFAGAAISANSVSATGNITAGQYFGTFMGTIPNALYSTGNYSDPTWLSALSGSKILANSITAAQIKNVQWNQLIGTPPGVSSFPNDAGYINSSANITGTSGGVQSPGGRETSSPSPNTVVMRDASGRSQILPPSNYYDAANKGYVDAVVAGVSNQATKIYIGPTPPTDLAGVWVDTSA